MIFNYLNRCLLCIGIFIPQVVLSDEIQVAVAANFMSPMKVIKKEFEYNTKHRIKLASGSSGKIYAQIKHGAPFDIFLSADQEKPRALERDGLVIAKSRMTYAVGRLVLWSRKETLSLDEHVFSKKNLYNKLSVANPKHSPYGEASYQVLEALSVKPFIYSRIVKGENIAQAFQFVTTKNADLGFVALSQLMPINQWNNNSYWLVPTSLHYPIKQDVVRLKRSYKNKAAEDFIHFIQSKAFGEVLEKFGYQSMKQVVLGS